MDEDIQQEIVKEVMDATKDMDIFQLLDLHIAYVLNVHFSMQNLIKHDISKELIKKHKLLCEKIRRL